MVSRVSPPARSIGLPRLQRGGTSASIAARRSSGSAASARPAAAQASAASTPQPPAVVNTTVRRPRGSGWVAKVAAHSKACSTLGARSAPTCAATPSKMRSSLASEPVWLAAARLPSARDAALEQHQRLSRRERARRLGEAAAVGHALEVRERDGGLGVRGEVVEVVREAELRGVARRDRLRDADARQHRIVQEARHQVPALARDRDAAGRRIRRHDLRAQRARGRDHALPVRAGHHHAERLGERDELALVTPARFARFGVAAARDEGGAHPARCACAQQLGVRGLRRTHEDEVRRALRQLRNVADRLAAEHLAAVAVQRPHLALEAEAQQVVIGDEAELAGMRRDARDQHAARMEERAQALEHLVHRWRGPAPPERARARRAPRAHPPPRACRRAPGAGWDSGRRSRRRAAPAPRARARPARRRWRRRRPPARRGTAPSRDGSRAGARSVRAPRPARAAPRRRPRRRAPRSGCRRDRARRTARTAGRARAPRSARAGPRPAPPPAATPRPSSGRAAASSSPAAALHRRRVAEAEAHQAALRLVRDGVAAQLHDHREADALCGRHRLAGCDRQTSRASGMPKPDSSAFDACSDRVCGRVWGFPLMGGGLSYASRRRMAWCKCGEAARAVSRRRTESRQWPRRPANSRGRPRSRTDA